MNSRTKRIVNFSIGFGLAALLIWLFFKDTNWAEVGVAITTIDLTILGLAFVIQTAGVFSRSWRWRTLLSPLKEDIPFLSAWKYFNIGFAITSLLPGRIGEVVRPYLMAREQKLKFTSAFATVVTERVIDLVAVLLMFSSIFIFPAALGPNPDSPDVALLKTAGMVVLGISSVAIIFLVIIRVRTNWAIAIVRFFAKPLPEKIREKLVELVEAFAAGVGGLKGFLPVFKLILGTVLAWTTGIIFYWLSFKAFGFEVPLIHCIFLQSATALGVSIPTPAGSGGFHGAIILVGSSLWGFAENPVKALAIITHLIIFGSMTLFGTFYLMTGHVKIFDAAAEAKRLEEDDEGEAEE